MDTIFVPFLPLPYPLPHLSNLSCVLLPSGIQDHFFILFVCVYNLMHPSSTACMYVCFMLTIWDWITYKGLSVGKTDSP